MPSLRADPSAHPGLPTLPGVEPLSQRLYDALEEAIIVEQLRPGQHLRGGDLARHYGVSRIPVREALRELHARGWVEIRPRQGAFVRERTTAEMEQLFELRAVLEAQSARWAAMRRSEEDLLRLDALVKEGSTAPLDTKRLTALNSEFHALVAASTRNDLLAESLSSMSKRVRWYFAAVAEHRRAASWKEHRRLVTALRQQDPEAAAQVILSHVEATHEALARSMAATG